LTCDFWPVIFDLWFLTCDFWPVIFDLWFPAAGSTPSAASCHWLRTWPNTWSCLKTPAIKRSLWVLEPCIIMAKWKMGLPLQRMPCTFFESWWQPWQSHHGVTVAIVFKWWGTPKHQKNIGEAWLTRPIRCLSEEEPGHTFMLHQRVASICLQGRVLTPLNLFYMAASLRLHWASCSPGALACTGGAGVHTHEYIHICTLTYIHIHTCELERLTLTGVPGWGREIRERSVHQLWRCQVRGSDSGFGGQDVETHVHQTPRLSCPSAALERMFAMPRGWALPAT